MGTGSIRRSRSAVEENLRTLRIVAGSWLVDAVVLTALAFISGTPLYVPLIYLTIGLTYVGLVYGATRYGLTERFADPTLSFPQLLIAACNQCLGLWLAPQIGIFFLFNVFQVFAYGLFSLNARQFGILLLTVVSLSLVAIIKHGETISFPVEGTAGQLLLFVVFSTCLGRFVWVGNYVSNLRNRISQKSAALAESEARFRSLTALSSDWYWEQDAELRITRVESGRDSKQALQQALVGKCPWESDFSVELDGGWNAYREQLARHEEFRDVIFRRKLADQQEYFVSVSAGPIFDRQGRFTGYRGVAREITEKRLAEDRIQYLATHDSLTGLPNRLMFTQLLDVSIESARRYSRKFAVLFIDLDRFKLINDTLGHEAGDELLKEIAARFKLCLRTSDIVARLGGDEFVVLVQELDEAKQAATVAEKLVAAAIKPVMLSQHECRVSASIGIAVFPEDADDSQDLMKNADSAMYLAKENGKNNYQFYSREITQHAHDRMALETELRHALERKEFQVHYQAKRDLKTGTISGVEALLRWNSTRLGAVPPVQFIHIAEETGLIVPIGKWVLRAACEQNMAWQQQGLPPIRMAVNLSVRQFSDNHLLEDIARILRETGMPAHLLELEITEGMVVHNPEQAINTLRAIRKMGVRLAIDDFGAGYSSLSQLRDFPIDILKVDRSFIRDIVNKAEERAITEGILAMGRLLNLTVVAEGVETEEQESFLRRNECDEVQGYYISKPIPAEEFAALLRTHERAMS